MFKKICWFGDSISKGVVYNEEKGRYTTSEHGFVKRIAAITGIDIKNFAMFGCTAVKGTEIIKRHESDVEDCDLVVLEFGGNDCDHPWGDISENPEGEFLPNVEKNLFVKTYKSLIEKLKEMGKKVAVCTLPPIDDEKYFNWISRDRNAENIKNWLGGSTEYIYRWQEMYNSMVCNIANSMKVCLIDLRTIFLEKKYYSQYICVDGIHPNEKGHDLLLEAVESKYNECFATANRY